MHDRHGSDPGDRRERLKARHRRAIVDAAASLMDAIGGTHFTVDQLAERADVSRRTVFNHFGSLDEVVLEVLSRALETVVDDIDAHLAAAAPDASAPMFDRLASALRSADVLTVAIRLKRTLGDEEQEPAPRGAALFERAFTDLNARFAEVVRRHDPDTDALTVDLMCGALVSGGLVVLRHWEEQTGGADSEESRRVWDRLLERMSVAVRTGYAPAASASPAASAGSIPSDRGPSGPGSSGSDPGEPGRP